MSAIVMNAPSMVVFVSYFLERESVAMAVRSSKCSSPLTLRRGSGR